MKVMTILGTRPEIIRLSRIIPLLDEHCEHSVVHTGQNFTPTLHDIFFSELGLRQPDYQLTCHADTPMNQIGAILSNCERVLAQERPDRILILGDTNSALASIAAKRLGIAVFHLEAGNRCYDDRVPEELNRRIVDHCSDILMPYTERSRSNLLREGIPNQRIFVTGNPIFEVLDFYSPQIDQSQALDRLSLNSKQYFLVTLHRAENVDNPNRLAQLLAALQNLQQAYGMQVVCSLHPRTRDQLAKQGQVLATNGIQALEPLGLFDFVQLEKNALCVLTDSGTVQEECNIYQIPNVTLRNVTERPETLESGSNIIAGCQPASVLAAVKLALSQTCIWEPPPEYLKQNVSNTVARLVLSCWPI